VGGSGVQGSGGVSEFDGEQGAGGEGVQAAQRQRGYGETVQNMEVWRGGRRREWREGEKLLWEKHVKRGKHNMVKNMHGKTLLGDDSHGGGRQMSRGDMHKHKL